MVDAASGSPAIKLMHLSYLAGRCVALSRRNSTMILSGFSDRHRLFSHMPYFGHLAPLSCGLRIAGCAFPYGLIERREVGAGGVDNAQLLASQALLGGECAIAQLENTRELANPPQPCGGPSRPGGFVQGHRRPTGLRSHPLTICSPRSPPTAPPTAAAPATDPTFSNGPRHSGVRSLASESAATSRADNSTASATAVLPSRRRRSSSKSSSDGTDKAAMGTRAGRVSARWRRRRGLPGGGGSGRCAGRAACRRSASPRTRVGRRRGSDPRR
ncbi:hypothetical protein SAMN05443665_10391 [Actinomadura meyerae]|uniref:Uncharacterized protein n=1 Tax=Actinomadura meyerae TaxID=240840 RepID=A0A239NBT0_9ACTN|nr:hypothetical protein SAMN05443665_10391 [Actinomadura meyerae]